MPWALTDEGKASEIAARLAGLNQGTGESDKSQFEAARSFAIDELNSLPADQLVKIDARGTRSEKEFTISFSMYLKGPLISPPKDSPKES